MQESEELHIMNTTVADKRIYHEEGSALNSKDSTSFAVIAILVCLTLGLSVYFFIRKKSEKLQYVLLIGRNAAGKTTLFAQLTQQRDVATVSSLMKNVAWTSGLVPGEPDRKVQLVDVPGFERIRWEVFEAYRNLSKAIIFVIDSTTISKDSQECADIVYRVLVDPEVQKRKMPVLVACNKQDEFSAKDVDVVQEILEKEINAIRITKYNPTTKKGSFGEYLGSTEKDFRFSQLKANKVSFVKCSTKGSPSDEVNLALVIDFLRTLS